MANRTQSSRESSIHRIRSVIHSLNRYDLALAAIPLAFLLGIVAHVVSPVPLQGAMILSAGIGLFVLADVLFVDPPRDSPPSSPPSDGSHAVTTTVWKRVK